MLNKELIKAKTPNNQSDEDKKLIQRIHNTCRKMNEADTSKQYEVRAIIPLDKDGMYVPDNLEILERSDFFKIKEGERTAGSITIENLLGKKSMRYQGRFVKGISMSEQKEAPITKAEKREVVEDEFTPMYDKLNSDFDDKSHDYFQEAIALLGRTAHLYSSPTRAELQKWCDKFGNYYKPKLTSVEQKGSVDNQIIIRLLDETGDNKQLIEADKIIKEDENDD